MPKSTIREIPPEEQAQMLAVLRRARYGYLLALPMLLWWDATPPRLPMSCAARAPVCTAPCEPIGRGPWAWSLTRTVGSAPPRADGWCRACWRGATLALTLHTKRGVTVSTETMRRWLHAVGWVWKRATLVATHDDPPRIARLARIRYHCEQLRLCEAMVLADELAIHLWPNVGCAWRPHGTQVAGMTPGQNQKHYLAGALDLATGTLHHALGPRKTNALFRNRLARLEAGYRAERYTRVSVVVDNDRLHKAKPVEQWLAAHPRVTLLFLPTYCPRANPIERAFGDVHDGYTRNQRRQRLPDLVTDGEEHLYVNGPWLYKLSEIS